MPFASDEGLRRLASASAKGGFAALANQFEVQLNGAFCGPNSRSRWRYSAELKAQILGECDVPGATVAKVAMAHGINANIVHGWRKLAREAGAVSVSKPFVPVTVALVVQGSSDQGAIEVELQCGAITVRVNWPICASMELSASSTRYVHTGGVVRT